jgi:hypothetical protein
MRLDLVVLHDCEGGGYEGSIRWFEVSRSNVSAHYVVREDGGEATQMVDLADNAWHACTFNRRSVGVEMGGFASRGFDARLLATRRACARICAIICKFRFAMRAPASGRASPRIVIAALQAAAITILRTTLSSWRNLLA